ncbi:protein of unknown function [Rhodovastum atsumiense]|nr:protein of unknown function [Rhodovastum atsumiense]
MELARPPCSTTTGRPSAGPNSARHISISLTGTRPATLAGGRSGIGGSTIQGFRLSGCASAGAAANGRPASNAAEASVRRPSICFPSFGHRRVRLGRT